MRRILAISLALIVLGACSKTAPIYNVEQERIVTGSGKTPTMSQVERAILGAVVQKTWKVDQQNPGRIDAHFAKKTLVARIRIAYDTEKYSIRYRDSQNLLYSNGVIHRRYNAWIKGLVITINANLIRL